MRKQWMKTGIIAAGIAVVVLAVGGWALLSRTPASSDQHNNHMAHATAASAAAYPLDVCIVSGEKLGEMGDPVKYDYKGREIQFCCKSCINEFEADPEKYLSRLN